MNLIESQRSPNLAQWKRLVKVWNSQLKWWAFFPIQVLNLKSSGNKPSIQDPSQMVLMVIIWFIKLNQTLNLRNCNTKSYQTVLTNNSKWRHLQCMTKIYSNSFRNTHLIHPIVINWIISKVQTVDHQGPRQQKQNKVFQNLVYIT